MCYIMGRNFTSLDIKYKNFFAVVQKKILLSKLA